MNSAPLYPTEELLWNENLVPNEFLSGDECLALPKLGLQFLTLQDYLMRNFTLFRLESTFEIRQVRTFTIEIPILIGRPILEISFLTHPNVSKIDFQKSFSCYLGELEYICNYCQRSTYVRF